MSGEYIELRRLKDEHDHVKNLTDEQWLASITYVNDDRATLYRMPRHRGDTLYIQREATTVRKIEPDGGSRLHEFTASGNE
jgi:hypothetical protein